MSQSLPFLRTGLPESYPFSVSQRPHRAKLDQNESPVDVPEDLKRELVDELARLPWNRYVQPAQYAEAKRALAGELGLAPERVALTVGADQAIEAAFAVAGGPGRRARWFEPTYPYIAQAARRTHTEGEPIELSPTIPGVLGAPHAHMIVLVSPNNPTGAEVGDDVVRAALSRPSCLVLLDEAYAAFTPEHRLGWLDEHPNLVIARSLSKSMLAGVHVGCLAGHPSVVAIVENLFTAPYHLDAFQLVIARNYARLKPHVEAAAANVVAERDRIAEALRAEPGVAPRSSAANFVLFDVDGGAARATEIFDALADAGVRIRNVGGLPGLAGSLRVTVGTPEDNDLFISCLRDALSSAPA